MTSDEIKDKAAIELSTNGWLKEICFQLALLNEKPVPPAPAPYGSPKLVSKR